MWGYSAHFLQYKKHSAEYSEHSAEYSEISKPDVGVLRDFLVE